MNSSGAAASAPDPDRAATSAALDVMAARHAADIAPLRAMIAELLSLVESLRGDGAAARRPAAADLAPARETAFLAMLAHELRNPLAPIAMSNELLGKITDAHPQLPKLHAVIGRQVDHMVRLVDDLLDASRLSSGTIVLRKAALTLDEVIASAVETSQPAITRRYQRLELDLPSQPLPLDGDLVRLAQVFSNLLLNASKFTPEHESITLRARRQGATVSVSVKDNGAGIAVELQPFIFDLFTQGFCSLERSQGGLGVGLSLVRNVVELHGGSVRAFSRGPGFGSEFLVELPLLPALLPVAAAPLAVPVVAPPPRRVLLIEDNLDANETLKLLLEIEGHSVASAFDGPSGVRMARESDYDVIVCDIGLPGMSGFEVVRALRAGAQGAQPHYIAASGYNQAADRSQATAAGFDHYLVKPVALDKLLALMAQGAAR